MTIKIQVRRGTSSQWSSANPTLSAGEIGYETNTKKLKIGDGTTTWGSLAYFPDSSVIKFDPIGSISSSTVASALQELDSDITSLTATVNTKQNIAFTPQGGIGSSTITGALIELDQKKIGPTTAFGGQVTGTYGTLTVNATHGSGITSHHAQSHTHALAADGTVSHDSLSNVTADQHHAQLHTHALAADGTVSHSSLSNIGTALASDIHHSLGTLAHQAASGTHAHSNYQGIIYATADQSIPSSTTLTAANLLNIPVAANAVVNVEYSLPFISSVQASGVKVGFTTLPTNGTIQWSAIHTGLTAGSLTVTTTATASAAIASAGAALAIPASALVQWINIRGYYVGGNTAGSIILQWAPNALSTTAVVLKKGAWVRYTVV